MSAMIKRLINSDSYLFTIEECARMMRMSRTKFEDEYIKAQLIDVVLLKNKKFVRHETIKKYLDSCSRVYADQRAAQGGVLG